MRWTILFAFAIACWSSAAIADTGTQLQSTCKKPDIGYAYCLGYITGATQALSAWSAATPKEARSKATSPNVPSLYCLPREVSNVQTMQVVVRYMDEHPDRLNLSADTLVGYALEAAYPCAKP
jgi:hypothetical protein